MKSTTTRHQMGAFEWNAGLVAGVALNARLTFKNVNLAGPVLESCILPQHSSIDPDHGAPDSAATPSHHLLSHPLSFSVRPSDFLAISS